MILSIKTWTKDIKNSSRSSTFPTNTPQYKYLQPLKRGSIIIPEKFREYLEEKVKQFASERDYLKSLLDCINEVRYFQTLRDLETRYPQMKECMIRTGKI